MRRREVLVGGGSIAAAALAGCTSQANPGSSSNTDGPTRTISVSGQGSAVGDPDLARFRVGIQATGDDAGSVRDELVERSDTVRETLIEAGIPDDHITTGRFDVREVRRRPNPREEPAPDEDVDEEPEVYFEGAHTLEVELEDIDEIGAMIDVAIDAGADHVGRLQFALTDERREALREEALAEAVSHAESEAEIIATEIDAEIHDVKHVDTSGGSAPIVRHRVEYADDDVADTEIHPDDVTVGASVELVVEIR